MKRAGPPVGWDGNPPLVELRCTWCARNRKRTVLAAIWAVPTDWAAVVLVPGCPVHDRKRSRWGRAAAVDRDLRRGARLANYEHPVSEYRADIELAIRTGRTVFTDVIPATIVPGESTTG